MALLFVRDSLSNKFDLFLWWWCLGSLDIYYTVISNIVSAVTNTKDRPLFEKKNLILQKHHRRHLKISQNSNCLNKLCGHNLVTITDKNYGMHCNKGFLVQK